ncbi:ceramidase domain-containing protein [Parasphingorhabdus halotolerans]|uniref:Ceramidase n=1 Tax=Parasphingorhabdus halotolerans TaxID=2725558 RepID=A0A6H2DLV5_9SPHN|nr:ceramidase domain-containing protein [Parasphingorhabdus halotolerans]QJB69370.1 ceramidase [Parasphingorhabdus halotolerans]
MTNLSNKLLIALALTGIAAAITIGLLMLFGPDWSLYAPASCTATRCFCELPRTGDLILQPSNSWSAFGYVFAGFLMITLARTRDWASAFPPLAAQVFAISAITVGIGSVLLHGTLTLWGQFFDVLGMYLVSGFLLVSALAKWLRITDRRAALYYVLLCAVLVAVLIALPEVRRWLYGVVLIAAIILELTFARPLRLQVKTRYYFYGIIAKAVAFGIWNLDQHGKVCAPESLLQGHAIWHLLGASALWFTFLYYRSEAASEPE